MVSSSVRQVILDAKVGPPLYEKGLAKDILSVVSLFIVIVLLVFFLRKSFLTSLIWIILTLLLLEHWGCGYLSSVCFVHYSSCLVAWTIVKHFTQYYFVSIPNIPCKLFIENLILIIYGADDFVLESSCFYLDSAC